jgi:hypothetical protein
LIRRRPSLPLRLSTLPALAGLVVLTIAFFTCLDLGKTPGRVEDSDTLQVLRRPRTEALVPRSRDVPKLTEREALEALAQHPGRAAIEALWPLEAHRQRLFEILLSAETPEEIRLLLLGRFERESEDLALEGARAIAGEKDLSQGPLRLAAYDIIARLGSAYDLSLLEARPFELHQTKTLREAYLDSLKKRIARG